MKTTILSLALLVCAPLFFCSARVDAGDKKGSLEVVADNDHQRGGWLGVSIQDITSKLAKKKNLKNEDGVYVNDVLDDSPADSAGVKEGDVIVEFNGKTIDDAGDLLRAVHKSKPGDKTTIVVIRNDDKKSLAISVGKSRHNSHVSAFAFTPPIPPSPHIALFGSARRWGLQLSELNEQLGEYFGAPNGRGLLVEQVEKKSAGAKAGFKAGDVITKINKNSIEDMRDLSEALEDAQEGDKVSVEVLRKGSNTTLTVEIEDSDDPPSSFNFHFENVPDLDGFHPEGIQLRIPSLPSLPDMRDLKMQINHFRETMTHVTV
jgi:membrane-associated protease RseP (regulator of RpoE activity)